MVKKLVVFFCCIFAFLSEGICKEQGCIIASPSELKPDKKCEINAVMDEVEFIKSKGIPYKISTNDQIAVYVQDVPELSKDLVVDQDGRMVYPLIDFDVRGLTLQEFEKILGQRLRSSLKNDKITPCASVVKLAQDRLFVVGNVVSPGVYSHSQENKTILDYINSAGGINQNPGGVVVLINLKNSADNTIITDQDLRQNLNSNMDVVYVCKYYLGDIELFNAEILPSIMDIELIKKK